MKKATKKQFIEIFNAKEEVVDRGNTGYLRVILEKSTLENLFKWIDKYKKL